MHKLKMPAVPEWLDAKTRGRPVGVDREAKIVRGYIVAELGAFKSEGRGQFTSESLDRIVALYKDKPAGLKSRFTHPSLSSDGLGSHLGRSKNAFRDGNAVRADLHLADAAFTSPKGDLGTYILDLAEEDPNAFASSLVLKVDKIEVTDEKGKPRFDADGNPFPPVWMPTELHASDVVDVGDATNGFLSYGIAGDELPDGALRVADSVLARVFEGCSREVVESRVKAWLERYLSRRYGETAGPSPDTLARIRQLRDRDRESQELTERTHQKITI